LVPVDVMLRGLQSELNSATTAMNRIGVNFNQAVAWMHKHKRVPGNLERYAEACTRAIRRADDIAVRIARRLR